MTVDLKERLGLDSPLFDIRLFDVAGTPITVATLVIFLAIVLATLLISHAVQRAAVRALKLRGITATGTVGVTRRLLHYLILALGLGVGLQTVGVNLAALFATGAFLAIGVGQFRVART